MDRAAIGNRQQPATLFLVQHAFELDISFNERESGRARFAIGTIFSVDARMTEAKVTRSSAHCLRRAYIAIVMDVHEPSPASSRSYGVGPVSVPPTDVGSSPMN